jgi:peptidoglycan hydrolase FlgJ
MSEVSTVSALAATPRPAKAELSKAAKQFEAIFLRQMIASMRSPSLGDELFGSDAANQFRDMSDARLADSMAGKFGIAKMLEKQFAR